MDAGANASLTPNTGCRSGGFGDDVAGLEYPATTGDWPIHGNALGGGVGLASICDVAVGVDGALMGLTETKLGLIPATIGPYVIARMGEASARRVFMSSRQFSAQEAQQLGLLASVVTQDRLDAAVAAEVELLFDLCAGRGCCGKIFGARLGPQDRLTDH